MASVSSGAVVRTGEGIVSQKRKKNSVNPAKRPPAHKRVDPMEPEDAKTAADLYQAMQYYARRAVEVFSGQILDLVPDEKRSEMVSLLVKYEDAVRAGDAVELFVLTDEEFLAAMEQGMSPHQIFFEHLMGPGEEGAETLSDIVAPALNQINEEDAQGLGNAEMGRVCE